MRKVFLSTVILSPIKGMTIHQSRDYDLGDKKFIFPISYLLDANIASDDEIVIITGMTATDVTESNYEKLLQETGEILAAHNVKAKFIKIMEPDTVAERELQDSLSFSAFMKEISDQIQDGDSIYADMTYGMKSYTLAMFIALNYVSKTCRDVEIKETIYAQFYKGQGEKPGTADIIDITGLFRLNNIVSNAKLGQKAEMDKFLSFMIG